MAGDGHGTGARLTGLARSVIGGVADKDDELVPACFHLDRGEELRVEWIGDVGDEDHNRVRAPLAKIHSLPIGLEIERLSRLEYANARRFADLIGIGERPRDRSNGKAGRLSDIADCGPSRQILILGSFGQ